MSVAVEWRRISAFDVYLRTGRRIDEGLGAGWSTKFNPYHDPRDGRFTYASVGMARRPRIPFQGGGGSFDGGGAGGSFGGGGATGSWEGPDKQSEVQRHRSPSVATERAHGQPRSADRTVTRNGYSYRIDSAGRTKEVSGTISLSSSAPRSRSEQARAGGRDRLHTDDGGHYIAARFNGPTEAFNHFAQDRNFNRGAYRKVETGWAQATQQGHRVVVDIVPIYSGNSHRPDRIVVSWRVGNVRTSREFKNRPGGR